MLRHQALDQLEVVASFGRRSNQLRLEQFVQPEQRRIAHELVLDELCRCVGAFMGKHLAEERVQEIERRILVLVAAQHPYALRDVPVFAVRVGKPVRDQAEKGGILRFDALPGCGSHVVITLLGLDVAEQDRRSRAQLVFRQSLLEMAACLFELRAQHRSLRQLAIIVGDFLEVRSLRERLHPLGDIDRLLPVLFLLEDLQQEAKRLDLERAAVELAEELFGAIEESRAMKILRQLEYRQLPLVGGQIMAIEQILVHADRAIDLALAPKQVTQGKMQIDGLRIDFDDLDERLDRLVRLLVQKKVETAKIRQRQRPRLTQQMLDIDARGNPTKREKKHRECQQPPELDFHRRHGSSASVDRMLHRCVAHFPAQAVQLPFQTRGAKQSGEQTRCGAGRESDEDQKDQRRLPGEPVIETDGDQLIVLQRQEKKRHEQRHPHDPADERHQNRPPLDGPVSGAAPRSVRTRPKSKGGIIVTDNAAPLRWPSLLEIDAFAQFLAGLEIRHTLLRYLYPLAGFGIAACPRWPVVEPEAAETANLDPLAFRQTFGHGV